MYALFSFWVTLITCFVMIVGLSVIPPNDKKNCDRVDKVIWFFIIMVVVTIVLFIATAVSGGY